MKELDYMYGGETTAQEMQDMEQEEDSKLTDPYMKKKKRTMKP